MTDSPSYEFILLVTSLGILFLGPLLYKLVQAQESLLSAMDSFIFVAIFGLVLVHIMPESIERGGWLALVLMAVGLFAPLVLERSLRRVAKEAHTISLGIALLGLISHAIVDGIALSGSLSHLSPTKHAIPLAIVLHRLPDGLMIWHLLCPTYGGRAAISTLMLMGIATVIGFVIGDSAFFVTSNFSLSIFQGLVAGSLLHVMIHQPHFASHLRGSQKRYSMSGTGLALLFLIALEGEHLLTMTIAKSPFWQNFLDLALKSTAALFFAYLISALIYAFLPKAGMGWLNRGSPLGQSLRGMIFGLPLPICSCGVLPIYQSLIRQGSSVSAGMAFLIATPELSLDAFLLSFPLLGVPFTIARLLTAAIVAMLVGWGLGQWVRRTLPVPAASVSCLNPDRPLGLKARLSFGSRIGFLEMVDTTAPWILLGLGIAAAIAPLTTAHWLSAIPKGWDIPLFALLGIPVYVCASGATPLCAVLIASGVSPGAAMAFLITGPATNVTTFGVLSNLHGRKVALMFGSSIALLSIIAGYAINCLLPHVEVMTLGQGLDPEGTAFQWLCLLLVFLLFVVSLLRQGPRHFVAQILPSTDSHSS